MKVIKSCQKNSIRVTQIQVQPSNGRNTGTEENRLKIYLRFYASLIKLILGRNIRSIIPARCECGEKPGESVCGSLPQSKKKIVLFTPSLGRVRRPCRGLEKFSPPVLQRCYGCSFSRTRDCAHRSRHVVFFLSFFLFWRERCLSKEGWKSNPAAPPGLANQVWPF